MKRFAIAMILLMEAACLQAIGQGKEYLIEIQSGKKILNVENVSLPATTPVTDLLQLFPELLVREGDMTLNNYDVQVNDVSCGDAKGSVLKQYRLGDIKSIEVSQTPSTSQQKNGQGGVIKIKLKKVEDGVSGNVSVFASSMVNARPGVTVNWKKDKLTLRSSFIMEYYHPVNEIKERATTTYDSNAKYQTDTMNINNGFEMLKLDLLYKPNNHNELHVWALERYSINSDDRNTTIEINSVCQNSSSDEKDKTFSYLAGINYIHTFELDKLETEVTVEGAPENYSLLKYDEDARTPLNNWNYQSRQNYFYTSGLLKYTHSFVKATPKEKANLIGGVNFNYNPGVFDYKYYMIPVNGVISYVPQAEELSAERSILYLSPYVESDNVFGKWFLKAGLRFQHYDSQMKSDKYDSFTKPENYFTAFINLGYQVAPHHHLSLILDRSVKRMEYYQLYPYKNYSPEFEYFIIGNPDLKPVSVHNAALNYITDFKAGGHFFTIDAELKYINADKLIQSDKDEETITYKNEGTSHIGVADFQLIYNYRKLTLAMTANFFANNKIIENQSDKYSYYNISLVPMLQFEDGWRISASFTYNSHIYTQNSRLSDYLYTAARFSKSWEKVTAYLEMNDNYHQTAKDEYFGSALSECLYYNLHRPSVELGMYIKF